MRFRVIRIGFDHRLELLLRFRNLAGVPEDDALVVHRVDVSGAPAGCPRCSSELRGLRAGRRRLVEFALRVVNVGETAVRLAVIRFDLDGLLVGRFGLVVFLLLRVRVADVVVAVGARGAQLVAVRELGNRFVVVAGAARGDAFFERLLQLGALGELLFVRRRVLAGEHEVHFGRLSDADARVVRLRPDALLFRRHFIGAALQPDLDEFTLLVRLGFLLAVDALDELDRDLCAVDRLALVVADLALHHAGRLRGGRYGEAECEDDRAHVPLGMTAVQSANHGNPPRG